MRRALMPILIATVLFASVFLAACSAATSDGPAAGDSGVTVIDALGRTVEFPAPPQRIVVAGKSSLTIVNALYLFPEARDRVAGLVVGRQNPGDFLGFVDPTFEEKIVLEVEAGPEQIAPLKPDVVILRSFMQEKLGKPLEQVEIPVVYVDLETPDQYFRDLITLGQMFGNEARAEEIHAFYQARLDRLDEGLRATDDDQRPTVLVVQYSDQGGDVALNVPSASWLQTTEAELAGGLPIWKEAAQGGGWTVVNFEQIAAWDPDQVFVISYHLDPSQAVSKLAANPRWQVLRAVEEGQLYAFAGDVYSWDQPDPRWVLGVTWLASKMHPDRWDDLDLMDEVSQFFGEMYGLDDASIQKNILPLLKGDVE